MMHFCRILFMTLVGCWACIPVALAQTKTPKVALIGLDGVRGDALKAANAPNIKLLANNGTITYESLTEHPTSTVVGFSTILSGVWSKKHNNLGSPNAVAKFGKYPILTRRIEAFDSLLHTVVISTSSFTTINNHVSGTVDDVIYVNSDFEARNHAVDILTYQDPDFINIYFRDIDHFGHIVGFHPQLPDYQQAIEFVDLLIGDVVNAIQNRATYASEDWLIILTSDHGGIGVQHGGGSLKEREVFFLLSGDSIPNQVLAKDSNTTQIDSAFRFNGIDNFVQPEQEIRITNQRGFTIEFQMKEAGSLPNSIIISNKDGILPESKGFAVFLSDNPGREVIASAADGSSVKQVIGYPTASGGWFHVSVTFDYDGQATILMNGVPINSVDISSIGDFLSNQGIVIAQNLQVNYPSPYAGYLREIRIWDVLLDEGTISDYIGAPVDGQHPYFDKLLAYYPLHQDPGQSFEDAGWYGNSATVFGTGNNWQAAQGMLTYFNYSKLPKIVDATYTALDHLCIPINPAWELDGNSILTKECPPIYCDSVTNLSVKVQSINAALLQWDSVQGAVYYVIRGKITEEEEGYEEWFYDQTVPGGPTSIIVSNLIGDTGYVWQVQAMCDTGGQTFSSFSEPDSFETSCGVPGPIFVTYIADGSVWLNWKRVPNAESYTIIATNLSGSFNTSFTVFGSDTNRLRVDNLMIGDQFTWSVRANCLGASFFSDITPVDTFSIAIVYDTIITAYDTIVTGGDTIITIADTIFQPLDTFVVCDTIVTPLDTVITPGDSITFTDTIYLPADTIVVPPDTIYVPPGFKVLKDTILVPPYTFVMPNDTLYSPAAIYASIPNVLILPPDTLAVPVDTYFFEIDTFVVSTGLFFFQHLPFIEPPSVYITEPDTYIQKKDLFFIPADTFVVPGDTFTLPGLLLTNDGDTVPTPADTIYLPAETIYVPADTIYIADSIKFQPPDTTITGGDVLINNCTTTIIIDTIYILADTVIQPADTTYLPIDSTIVAVDTVIGKSSIVFAPPPPSGDGTDPTVFDDPALAVQIVPNPFSSEAVIHFHNPEGATYRLFVYSGSGKLVRSYEAIKTSSLTFNRRDLPNGMYFIQLQGTHSYTGKFVLK